MSSIKSDEEIEALLNHKNNTLPKTGVEVKIIGPGNHGKGGRKSGTPTDRNKDNHATVAVTAELIGNKAASELFNVHPATVSNYVNGRNSNHVPDPVLQEKIEQRIGKINNKIVDKVDQLLEIFSEDVMVNLKPGEIPTSIERLVNTHDKINRRHEKGDGSNKPQVILYAPKQINISEYITKEV